MLLLCDSHSFGADQDVTWTLWHCGITSFQEDQMLIIIVDVTHCCYLMDWDAMQDTLNLVVMTNIKIMYHCCCVLLSVFVTYSSSVIFDDLYVVS